MIVALLALALAAEAGMTLTVAAEDGSRSVLVVGTTSRADDVTMLVVSPDGNIVDAYQMTPEPDGSFVQEIRISPAWLQDGAYRIRAQQGNYELYSAEAGVDVAGGRALETESVQSTTDRLAEPAERARVLEVSADGEIGSEMVTVSGMAATLEAPVRVQVRGPDGEIVVVAEIEPLRDGAFSALLEIGGSLWEKDGFYTVEARQDGDPAYQDSAEIEIRGGVVVPEFGAAVALAAAGLAGAVAVGRRIGHRII